MLPTLPRALRVPLAILVVLAVVVALFVAVDRTADHRAARAAASHAPTGDLGHVTIPGDRQDFTRFRIGAIDGTRLTPNKTDFAARTVDDGPLMLFLPATRAKPADYQLFLSTATAAGYHVLGLDYWNLGTTLSGTCETDPRCYTQVQRNRFDGSDPSRFSAVEPAGSITSRFRDAITHLTAADPAGGWSRFVKGDGDIDWSDIVVAGHSQGGGEAAYIAHIRPVLGALMFSSPVESDGTFHAAWMDHPGVTPVSRMYSIDDVRDVFGPRIRGSWKVLGLDGTDGPYMTRTEAPAAGEDPHAILTRLDVGDPDRSHSLTIDDSTPLDANGDPKMLPLWEWMLDRFPLPSTHSAGERSSPSSAASPTPAVR
ncbi:BPSS1187 family protein [Curtobacterium sp. RRHDQ10]|uniref:BPSS1187 family protein n=1 Tax=Curtobacterium phyllosphaerae TaxID=3413379 RepID=UPI003BF19E96